MSPEMMLDKLKSRSSRRTQKTLDAIYEVCKSQLEAGATNFSYSHVAKVGKDHGVPSKQSLHNKSGELYRVLIDAFAETVREKSSNRRSEDWIERIDNPSQKLLTRKMEVELKEAKKVIDELKTPSSEIYVYDNAGSSGEDKETLTHVERKALEYITSLTFKRKWGFTENEFGEYVDEKGGVIFRSGTLDAIRKALRVL
ncbi:MULTISPECIES: gamma-mobile-trio protein GmtX [Idiomarina]|jgi:arginyl-tRNA synthetase|uniref:gamma-mobile-trio protein GmtX n=1 Tax=Idiomarina TaxID=135575 RepID=UPI00241C0894|nr:MULTISPECIES: gamma-mobile-trio protein GmtX [Idiomarina]|tara:strand:+ start:4297 stop:4893 length:597 start_codon:yes stop_codon:yes gene_type:complete